MGCVGGVQPHRLQNDLPQIAFNKDTDSFFVGADFSPFDNMVAGVALGYMDEDNVTAFNFGEANTDGFTIAPYIGFLLDIDGIPLEITADFATGWTNLEIDQFRRAAAGGAPITSTTDKDIFFFATNVNATKEMGDVLLGARVGMNYGSSNTDTFAESNGNIVGERDASQGTFQAEGNFRYYWGNFEPSAYIIYEIDISKIDIATAVAPQSANDVNDVIVGLGLNWYSDYGWTAGLSWEKSLDRQEFEYDSLSIRIRADF